MAHPVAELQMRQDAVATLYSCERASVSTARQRSSSLLEVKLDLSAILLSGTALKAPFVKSN